jgi:protein LSM14
LKFVGDFDFEKSNAEFDKNAIEDEIKKCLSIKPTKSETTSESPKSEQEKDKENQPTMSSSTQSELQEINPDGYYDKQKSFFDRISCESNEKEKT